VLIRRSASQARRLGIKNLRTDDWAVITAIPWYTLLVVSLNKIIFGGGSNYMTAEEIAELTPESKHNREIGSKWVFLSEEVMVLTVWTCKVCMLLLYKRLMYALPLRLYHCSSRLGLNKKLELTSTATGRDWCRRESLTPSLSTLESVSSHASSPSSPLVDPFPGTGLFLLRTVSAAICVRLSGKLIKSIILDQCWSYFDFEIVEATFNVSADLAVLIVALPLLIRLSIPVPQKMILLSVFGMGIFVIVAALLTKIYSLVPALVSYSYLNWYFREASVSLYVTNLPALWALLRDTFPAVKNWGYSSHSYIDAPGSRKTRLSHLGQNHNSNGDVEMLDEERDNDFWDEMPRSQSNDPINPLHVSQLR
jgi:hypothetical protein